VEDWDQDFVDHEADHEASPAKGVPSPLQQFTELKRDTRFGVRGLTGRAARGHNKSLTLDSLDTINQRLLRLKGVAHTLAVCDVPCKCPPSMNWSVDWAMPPPPPSDAEYNKSVSELQAELAAKRDDMALVRTGSALSELHLKQGRIEAAGAEAANALRVLDSVPANISPREGLILRAQLHLLQALIAREMQDTFKATRSLKQAASVLADMDDVRPHPPTHPPCSRAFVF